MPLPQMHNLPFQLGVFPEWLKISLKGMNMAITTFKFFNVRKIIITTLVPFV
jgi:hypothetical protein